MKTRIKEFDWRLDEELGRRKRYVKKKRPLLERKICAECGDAILIEPMYRFGIGDYKFFCQDCVKSWEEAYDKGCSDEYSKRIYKSVGY